MTDVPPALAQIESELVAPGGPFEMVDEDVLGERLSVFKNRARTLREHLTSSVAFGDAEYFAFSAGPPETDRRITFREHERVVASVAAGLRDRYGVGPGDRVAILAANCPEWIVTFWATISLGAIAVGLNGWWTGPEIRFGIDDARPRVLVADRTRLDRLAGHDSLAGNDAAAGTHAPVPTVVVEEGFGELWHHDLDASLPDAPIDEDDPALILYTSGTTGRPKGAINTHRNVNALLGLSFFHGLRVLSLHPPVPDSPASCQLVSSPLFHVSGLHNAAVAFLVGGVRSVWTLGRFDATVVMGLIERERVTGWAFTATMLHRVVHHPDVDRYDLSSLRTGGGGGSAFAPTLVRRAKEVLPGLATTMGVGYGLTECAALATLNTGVELDRHPDSVGRPLPTVQLEIRDPRGEVMPDGEDGEIHLRGPMVMPGYWNRPDADAETFRPGRWLRTGDIGRMVDGRLFLASRKRDLIVRGGENVYPVEIEHRLEEHPAVAEAAVVAVDHDELGQEVKAVVVVVPGARIDADELARFVAEALAYFKVPAHWELRSESLPRNATGKVLKQVLTGEAESQFVEE